MATDAEALAKRVGEIRLRQIAMVIIACCSTIAAIGAGFVGWQQLGGPIPATREFVLEHIRPIADGQEELAEFAKGTRSLLIQLEYGDTLERIVLLEEKVAEGKASRDTRLLLQSKRREADKLRRQLEGLKD